jgi:hypothetical protein
MSNAANAALAEPWKDLWNGDLGVTDKIIAENFLNASPDGLWVMDRVQKGDGGEWQVFVRAQTDGDWWLAADVDDKVAFATFGPGTLYLLSWLGAPHGKVLRLPLRGWGNRQASCPGSSA